VKQLNSETAAEKKGETVKQRNSSFQNECETVKQRKSDFRQNFALWARRLNRKTKEVLEVRSFFCFRILIIFLMKEFNMVEIIETVPIPIVSDSMAICTARRFSIVLSTSLSSMNI
jgi:hypothetical protein